MFLSSDLASLGELEAGTLRLQKRATNSDTVSVDCRSDKGFVSISIASATMTMPATAAQLVRGDDPSIGARTQPARVLLAARGGTLSGVRESMGRGQRLIARLPV